MEKELSIYFAFPITNYIYQDNKIADEEKLLFKEDYRKNNNIRKT